MLASGIAELISLGAILPFLAILANPDKLWEQSFLQFFIVRTGFTQPRDLIIPFTILFAAATILASIVRLSNLWLNGRFAAAVGIDLSCEAFMRTLYQPYSVHVQRNSATIISTITNDLSLSISAIKSFLQLITSVIVSLGLFCGLLIVDAQASLSITLIFIIAYGLISYTSRSELKTNSQKIVLASRLRLKILQESLGAIRDVLLDSSQNTYLLNYRSAELPHRLIQANNAYISSFPRFTLEAVGMIVLSLFGCIFVMQSGESVSVIPLLGVFALGAQRLLPSLQQIYSSWVNIKSSSSQIISLLTLLNQPIPSPSLSEKPLQFKETIKLENVSFRYTPDQSMVVQRLNLSILCGERVGIIGNTGCGKSTTVDILMGLLKPTSGHS